MPHAVLRTQAASVLWQEVWGARRLRGGSEINLGVKSVLQPLWPLDDRCDSGLSSLGKEMSKQQENRSLPVGPSVLALHL